MRTAMKHGTTWLIGWIDDGMDVSSLCIFGNLNMHVYYYLLLSLLVLWGHRFVSSLLLCFALIDQSFFFVLFFCMHWIRIHPSIYVFSLYTYNLLRSYFDRLSTA